MKKLRAGIIGLGVGAAHIEGYQNHPQCEVVAVCDFLEEKLTAVKNKHPHIRCTKRAEEILEAKDIDVVSIASFDNHHFEQILLGLKNDKHLFIEKPICLHEEEFAQIHEEYRKKPHLKISSNLILRASPRFKNLKENIASGKLGELYCIDAAYNYGRLHKIHQGWRGNLPDYSVMLGGGIHLVDLILWLTQDRIQEVHAYGNAICSKGSSFKNKDMVLAIAKFESGMVGKIAANFGCVYPHFHELVVYGTKGTFMNGLQDAKLFQSREPQTPPSSIQDAYPGTHKGDLISNFVQSILKETKPDVSWSEIASTMAVCFAIDRSIQEGRPIKVNTYSMESV